MNDKWPGIIICCMFICTSVAAILIRLFGGPVPSNDFSNVPTAEYNCHAYIDLGNGWIHDPDCVTCIRRDLSITSAHATNKTTVVTTHGIPVTNSNLNLPPGLSMEHPVLIVESNEVYY